jgi:cytosine/adenosine deaminase-related metal-dependent hydrolase
VLLPGLINAHTHLELTRLHGRLAQAGSFTAWLAAVIGARRDWTREDYLESIRRGARLALESGTTLVGDITASGMSGDALGRERLRKVIFEEVISLRPESAPEVLASLEARLERSPADPFQSHSASPHAPYSVSRELFRGVAALACSRNLRLAVHVAESKQELEFLQSGSGEFRQFLSALGALPEGWSPPGKPPVPYLEELGVLNRPATLIHCNYLDEDSLARIRNRSCSVVLCPRSHAFFGHDPHPVRRMLDMGINVALGSDSLASNESLSVLDEMRFLFRHRKDLKCDEIFRMATLNGAVALDFGGVLGRLRRGYWADMTVLRLPENVGERNLPAQILEGAGDCLATIVQGEIAWAKNQDIRAGRSE